MIIAGLDEAGRGALAGPVVAGAVVLPDKFKQDIFQDSKKLTEKKRQALFDFIKKELDWGVGIVQAEEIDCIGIKPATNKAMQIALSQLKEKPQKLLVDGRDTFIFDIKSQDIVRGDEIEQCISAASIIAKVTRDEIMIQYHEEFPAFDFEKNKGYGCPHHLSLLDKEIFCPLHRKTYDPLCTYLHQSRMF